MKLPADWRPPANKASMTPAAILRLNAFMVSIVSLWMLLLLAGCENSQPGSRSAAKTDHAGASVDNNWPGFRGIDASGIADNQHLPLRWNGESSQNIAWRTAIPGFAHSSPIVWGDRLFVSTAVSGSAEATFKHGLYGSGDSDDDLSVHRWQVYCLQKSTGEILWAKTAYKGQPKEKRHLKASYANSTPVTDGRTLVAFFGSQGAYAYDMNGNLKWKKGLGRLNAGAYDAPDYEWGTASSPIIYDNLVIFQCDTQDESFILACSIETGETLWRTARDELPSWSTPAVYPGEQRHELVTNGGKLIRGYNPRTGEQLWQLAGTSRIVAPTPVFIPGLIIVASGRRPEKPIFAIRPGAGGDISLQAGQTSNDFVAWHVSGRGPYMPTPLIYGEYLYVLNNNGVFDCYKIATGEEVYRQRLRHAGGGFSASPVASDGRIYLTGEDGEVFVVQAGPEYALLAHNKIGERVMATPAISAGKLYIRGEKQLFAVASD